MESLVRRKKVQSKHLCQNMKMDGNFLLLIFKRIETSVAQCD